MKKTLFIAVLAVLFTSQLFAQVTTQSVGISLSKSDIAENTVADYIFKTFGGNGIYSFRVVNSYTDADGMTHTDYQQYYRNTEVENCLLIVHSRAGMVMGINGQVATAQQMQSAQPRTTINTLQAIDIAAKATSITAVLPKADKVYTRYTAPDGNEYYKLAYRTRLTSIEQLKNIEIYIDCADGKVLKQHNMVLNATPQIITRTLDTYYPTNPDYTRVKRDIRMTQHSDSLFSLSDDQRKIYIHNGVTNVKPTPEMTDEEYINKIIETTPLKTSKSADNWDNYLLSEIIIDTVGVLRPGKTDNETILIDTLKTPYAISITDGEQTLVRVPNYNPSASLPPVTMKVPLELSHNHTYTLLLIRRIPTDASQLFFEDDTLFTYSFAVNNDGKTIINTDSVKGYITTESITSHALDVQYALHSTHEYYKAVHNRNSFDNKGTALHTFVDFIDNKYGITESNAFAWSAFPYFIATGTGDGKVYTDKFTTLDLLAHEYTHLVIMTNGRGGLKPSGESGAINEAIPDCFAVAIDKHTNGDRANWQIAEEGVLTKSPNMRDLSNPKMSGGGQSILLSYPQPNTYGGEYWKDPKDIMTDNGGVHYNNGVFNYWFYLITEGGEGTNDKGQTYSVKGLGIKQTEKLLMDVVLNYLTREATYSDLYNATRLCAEQKYGKEVLDQVSNAWMAVGVNSTTSDVDPIVDSNVNVYTNGNNIIVECETETPIALYTVLGQLIQTTTATSDVTSFTLDTYSNQVIMVKVGNTTHKVIL